MKLRLPLSLFAALTALFVSLPASVHAVEVPEGYTSYYLADPDELYDFRSDSSNIAFLLDGGVVFTSESASWWTGNTPLKQNGSVLFTIEEDGDPNNLTFADGSSYPAFYWLSTLSFQDIGVVTFQNITPYYGAIYNTTTVEFLNNRGVNFSGIQSGTNGGAVNATNLTIQNTSRGVKFSGNQGSGSGGAVYATTIAVENNSRGVSFEGNSTSKCGGALYGTTIDLNENDGLSFIENKVYAVSYSDRSSYTGYGGAICGRQGSAINVNGNTGGLTFRGNSVQLEYIYGNVYGYVYSYGGALAVESSAAINICDNQGPIVFEDNYVSAYNRYSYSYAYAYGGAIFAKSSVVNLKDNLGSVTFRGNYAETSGGSYGYAGTDAYGGAIALDSCTLNVSGNHQEVLFAENRVHNGNGGAISAQNSSVVNLEATTGNIVFKDNEATDGGALNGGASTFNLQALGGDILFENNMASSNGGAIYGPGSTVTICNSTGTVSFIGNSAQLGAAIYGGSLVIQNNESVVFERNMETSGRLRSIYLSNTLADGGKFHVSAAEGKNMTFTDGIYVATTTSGKSVDVVFNGSYIASDETEIAQGGDIIFDGGQVEGVLRELLGTEPTAEQIAESQTSYVGGITNLKAGRLIIRNGAQYNGLGISTATRSGAAVVLENAGMDHSSGSINIRRGTSLELIGCSQIAAGGLALASGSTMEFAVGAEQRETASLALDADLSHFSITLALNGADMLASGRYKLVELADASQYTSDDYWNADDITVTATGDAAGLGFDDLVWEDGVLYVVQGKTIWNNGSGDGVWNASSANWQRNGLAVNYRDGMDVHFDDTAAGTVQLEGAVSPLSVVVDNSTGHDYTFTGSGSLSGGTSLVKNGSGALSLATANEYTGGTRLNGGTLNVQHSQALGAAESTVVTAAGTQLNVTNNAAVVLAAATGNSLAGRVQVQAGASLEVQGTGYHAEATQLEGELIFSGEGVNHTGEGAGTLSGSGQLKVQGSGSSAQFSSAADYTGHVALADGAEFTADKLVMKADTTLAAVAAGTSLGLEDIMQPGAAQVEMHTTRFDSYTGTLDTDVAANCYSAGTLVLVDGLTLEGGSTYQADGSSLNLNGGSLTLNSGSGSDMFVKLMLSLDGAYTPEVTQIVLFTGVAEFCLGGQVLSTGDTTHVFAATDYLTGDYVFETTALVYDGNVGCVYLVEAMPEPTTTTLSLLALAGLAARRRRR